MSRRPALLLALAASIGACRPPGERGVEQRPVRTEASPSPAAAPDAAAPPPGAICAPDESRCRADDVAEACEGGARWVEQPCGPGSLCLGGACVSLRAPAAPDAGDAAALDPARLLAPAGEGWLNAWTATGPLPGPLPEDGAAEATDLPPPRPLIAPDGYVPVHERDPKKSAGTTHHALTGILVSARAQRILFAAGVAGRFRLSVDGQRVIDVTRDSDPPPFRDELRIPFDLGRGAHRVLVEVEQSTGAPTGFWLRARAPQGGPAPDLLFAPEQPFRLHDMLKVEATRKPVPGGFSLTLRPAWMGLGPRRPQDLHYRVELAESTGPARSLAEGDLPAASIGAADGALTLPVALEKAGTYELRIALGPDGASSRKESLVHRGALQKRILELDAKRDAVAQAQLSTGDRDSLLYHLGLLTEALAQNEPDLSWLKKQTDEAASLLDALARGENPYAKRQGVVHRAYRSPLDGRLQPYVLFVPRAATAGKKLPLVVAAHGLNNRPAMALRVVVGESPEDGGLNTILHARHLPSLPDFGAFIVAPSGFGNAGPRHLGEDDTLRVIDELRAHYPIDERRISLTGYSLGGTVAFALPFHYPDVFSASAPLCGYPNLLGWESIRKAPHTPWEDVILQKRYLVNWAENGLHVPLQIVHGGKDDPTRSQLVADRYRALGYNYKFDVQDDLDHNVWDYAYEDGDMIAWLKARKKPDVPSHVRFVTGEYRYDRAYWVRLVAMQDATRFADIDARYSKADAELRVTTKNVAAFGLDLAPLRLSEKARIVVDGRPVPGPFAAEMLWLTRDGDGFTRAPAEPSRAGKKRPGISGPLDDIDRHPKLVVYGTQDPLQTEWNRLVAEHMSSFDTFDARFPVKADVDVNDDDLQKKSLVLIGNPQSNRVIAALADRLPVKFEPGALVFRGKRYEGEDVGVSFIQPSPHNPNEYIVVHAGVTAQGTLGARHLPRFAPDFLVYDARINAQRGGHLLDHRPVLAGGFFDDDWQ